MVSLVFSALLARRAQTLALFALTILAALGGCAAPWFQGWAHESVASADIAAAPLTQRLVTVSGPAHWTPGSPQPVEHLRDVVGAAFPVDGGQVVVTMDTLAQVGPAATPRTATAPNRPLINVDLAYRDDVCAHLTLTGACPSGPDQAVLSRRVAGQLGVAVGDRVTFGAVQLPHLTTYTISGLYNVADLLSPYWAGASADPATGRPPLDQSAFVTEAAILASGGADGFDLGYHLVLPPAAFADSGTRLQALLAAAHARLSSTLSIGTSSDVLIAQIRKDQSLVRTGVDTAALQLVLLCWFALYLAVRYTSDARRPDIGLLRLRGANGWRVWGLTALQSAVPMVVGAAVGWALGLAVAGVIAGQWPGLAGPALVQSLLVAAAVGVGALVVSLAAETRALRSSVTTLMRRVPTRGGGWRTGVGDLVIGVLAAAGVYQGYADLHAGGGASGLALLAPALVGLAVALVVARALPWVVVWSGTAALRAGRTGTALSALHVARRPGTQRVFAVLAVAVSVLSTTLFFWQTATTSWDRRAAVDVGAARVLTVQAANTSMLLAAVRAADPEGRYAMAVARGAPDSGDLELAVDTTRLAAVAKLPAELGLPDAATLVRLLRPVTPAPFRLTDGAVTLDATGPPDGAPVRLVLRLVSPDGVWHDLTFPTIAAGRHTYTGTVTGCPHGCRLAAVKPITLSTTASIELFGLSQSGPVVTAQQFADISRWRPATEPGLVGSLISTNQGGLTLSVYNGQLTSFSTLDPTVYVADAPTPIPVVAIGTPPAALSQPGESRLAALGTEHLSYTVVASATVLPRLGAAGVLMDLEYAQLDNTGPTETVGMEVWLAADTPASVVAALRSGGLQILGDDSIAAATGRLRGQGPGVALRFELFAAIVLLFVAAGTIVVSSTVERQPRVQELTALRAQGLSEATMRRATYAATGLLAGTAIAVGLLAAVIAQSVVATSLPVFADSWSLLPVREGPWRLPLLLALGSALIVLGGAAGYGAARTVAAVRARRSTVGGAS